MFRRKYDSITDRVIKAYQKAGYSFLNAFMAGFLLFFLVFLKKTLFGKNYTELINTAQEGLALNSICLLFCLYFMIWGIYLFILGVNPALYFRIPDNEDWMLKRFANSFVSYSAVTLGFIFSARAFLRISQLIKLEPIKEVVSIGNINHQTIVIFLAFLIYVPHHYVLRPITEFKVHSSSGRIYKNRNRLKLIIFGVIITCISTLSMYYLFLM